MQTVPQKPGRGQSGRVRQLFESVYSTHFLGNQKLRNFLISVKTVANSRCQVDIYVYPSASVRALADGKMAYSA